MYAYKPNQLFNAIKAAKPDLVHVEQGPSAVSYAQTNLIAKLVNPRVKSIFFTWISWEPAQSLKHKLFFKPIEKCNLAAAHGALAGNRDAADILVQKGFKKLICVVPQLGVDTSTFVPKDTSLRVKKRIGFVGRFTVEKGILLLMEAFADLAHQFPDWDLAMVGTGPDRGQLEQSIQHHNLHERTHVIDPLPHDQVASFMETIDILVLPSYDTPVWREQFGHVLIEAMASGVAVIGSTAGEIPHVIGDAGVTFEQKNTAALLAQLTTLMQDEELRKKFASQGLERVNALYSHHAIARQTFTFWQSILGKKESA